MISNAKPPQAIYEIQVPGELDRSWETCFNGLTVTLAYTGKRTPVTTLICPAADQSALRGLVCKLWELNLTLISVRRIEADSK